MEPNVSVSKTSGKSMNDAAFEAYKSGQERFLWAHITAIVLSESALQQGFETIYDGLTRYYEFRMTPWVFATQDSIEDILSTTGIMNKSMLETLLHNPQRIHEQGSVLRPIKLFKFSKEMTEPAFTTFLPILKINEQQWSKNKKHDPKLEFSGAAFMHNFALQAFIPLEQLKGLRWVLSDTKRTSILIPDETAPDALIIITEIHPQISVKSENGERTMQVKVDVNGEVGNLMNKVEKLDQLEVQISERIQKELEELYRLGKEKNIDFFNYAHCLFRNRYKDWKAISEQQYVQHSELRHLQVNVNLEHSGTLKNKVVTDS